MRSAFDYAVVRVVPHVEREEFVNAGVVLFCADAEFLGARIELDEGRLRAVAPDADVDLVRRHLAAIPILCAGGAAAGPIGALTQRERFHFIVSPRSTILQTSAPHVGLCEVPGAALDRLVDRLVLVRPSPAGG